METVIFLYIIVTGIIYSSYLFDEKAGAFNIALILIGILNGWYIVPIFIGRIIRQIYD